MRNRETIYDTVIVGGGAAGLYAAAHSAKQKGLVIYKGKKPGAKLLMSGGGQCNLTHGGSIKDFPPHYGETGSKIRSILYRHNNEALASYFRQKGIPLIERDDGRIFPRSLKASDILSLLLDECRENGFALCRDNIIRISQINDSNEKIYRVTGTSAEYRCRKLIIATGGCSYPETGSDGSMFRILEEMGINLVPRRPALAPVFVQDYPYSALAGISFRDIELRLRNKAGKGDLLFTHKNFSGPVVLNCSHRVVPGDEIHINYLPEQPDLEMYLKKIQPNNAKQLVSVITGVSDRIPRSFAEVIAERAGIPPDKKFASLTGRELKRICALLTADVFRATGTGGYEIAMATAGGVDPGEIDVGTMVCKKWQDLYIVGEALDVNGDTGGYNLQFAFSSAYIAAKASAE